MPGNLQGMNEHPQPEVRPKAYSYLRFSTADQAKGDSFRRQTALAVEYASRHQLDLDETLSFRDLGTSAYRSRNATKGALRAFLDAVESEIVPPGSYLLVENLDRISRDQILSAQALFLEIVDAGIVLVTLADGRAYSKTSINANPTDLIISIVSLMRAHDESAMKSRRIAAAWSAKRARADREPMTSRCPGWLTYNKATRNFELIPERAEIVRRIFHATLAGVGAAAIARSLNAEGVSVFGDGSRRASMWHKSYVAKILQNPATMGTLTPCRIEHEGAKKRRIPLDPILNYYPAVIAAEEFESTQSLRKDSRSPLRGRHANGNVTNLLGGLCRCSECGGAFTLVTKSAKWRYLVCSRARGGAGCRYQAVRYNDVETTLLENIAYLTAECPSPSYSLEEEINSLEAALDAKHTAASALVDTIARGSTSNMVEERLSEIEAEIDEYNRRRAELVRRRLEMTGPLVEKRLAELKRLTIESDMDRRSVNATLRMLFSSVEISPHNSRMEFLWKHGGSTALYYGFPCDDG